MPAATAEPITPATFGPIACMSRKFCGLASRPTLFTTLAAIGTAETPADPMSGLIAVPPMRFIALAMSTPEAVPTVDRGLFDVVRCASATVGESALI